ncbi:MAG: BamA/TamA family outer membrane protein [Puia sp.]|nr:BamA/TamA family outer membrane protein [Puia sp.]
MVEMKRTISPGLLFFGFLFFCAGCHESKYLGSGLPLYTANQVKVVSGVKISGKNKKAVKAELVELLRPRLNTKLLGWRYKLWIYNISGSPKQQKGLRHWLKYKVGEPPVLASPTLIGKNRTILQNHLENRGYFHDTVILETPVRSKHLTAIYTANIGHRYTIRNVAFPKDTDALGKGIDSFQKRSLLKPGDGFDLDAIKNERTRIDARLKQRGYYYFSPEFLEVDADTSIGDHKLDMQLNIKPETPRKARNIYRIKDVVIYADYDIRSDTGLSRAYTTPEGYRILDTAHFLKPAVFSKTMVFKTGDLYKRDDHNLSLSRLVSLGVFKFVKARFEPVENSDSNRLLNAYYYLTPTLKRSIRFEASGLTRSDNTTGGELSVNWRNRNLFGGAELFSVNVYGGLEEQSIGGGVKVATRRGGINLNLFIPRIISPFNLNTSSAFVPKTKISAGYEIFDESSEYTLNSAKVSFGYVFKNSLTTENQLTVLGINFVRPSNISPAYQLGLDTNLTLARSIERQFIIGPTYNFNYNSLAKPNHRLNNIYFNGNVDLSNNLLGLLSGANINKGKQVEIFNTPFSQYVRLEADFRDYLSFSKYSTLATRITGGVGFAYGNSTTMPFIKEFFAGGTNDIRAFRSRALGPGSYFGGNPNTTPLLPDQPGDMKLEANAEYRAKLFSIVRWALFVDAGNIWTLKTDSTRPGSVFTSSFMKDIAVGVGTGLRFDLSILVLRIDMATPVREPWLVGSKWIFNKFGDISSYVLNLAIGYPF